MRYLLDTHSFLWHFAAPSKLGANARQVLAAAGSDLWLSVASVWELAIKHALGKLSLTAPPVDFVEARLPVMGCKVLPIELRHIRALSSLPPLHRDPFDRMLVAQAVADGFSIVSADGNVAAYGAPVIW